MTSEVDAAADPWKRPDRVSSLSRDDVCVAVDIIGDRYEVRGAAAYQVLVELAQDSRSTVRATASAIVRSDRLAG